MMFRVVFWDILPSSLMMEAVRTSETSVDNQFTRQYIPEDNSEHHRQIQFVIKEQSEISGFRGGENYDVLRVLTKRRVVSRLQHFGETYCLHV
jgi:hypothetical protein